MAIDSRQLLSGYLPLRDAMNLLFDGSVLAPESVRRHSTFPPVDLFMTDDDVLVELGVPGGNPENLTISVTGRTLVISGQVNRQRASETAHPYLQEIWQGSFQRSFTLPVQVDSSQAAASCVDGILTLRLPKAESAKRHMIQVAPQTPAITSDNNHRPEIAVPATPVAAPPAEVLVS